MIIAIVLSTVTPSTVKIRLRSECSFFGRTAAIAMAADPPQIATAPPVRRRLHRSERAPSPPSPRSRLFSLPRSPPDLQPAEPLWPVLDEPLANRYFAT